MALAGFVEILRPKNCAMAAIATAIGYFVSANAVVFNGVLFLAMVCAFMVCGAGQAVNDYFDREIDSRKKTAKAIREGKITPRQALWFSTALFAAGTALSFFISLHAFAIALVFSFLLFFYSKYLGSAKIAGNIVVALGTAFTLVYGASITGNYEIAALFALSAFFANLSREITKDLEDRDTDKGMKKTIAHFLPEKKIHAMVFFFYLCAGTIAVGTWAWKKSQNMLYLGLVIIAMAVFGTAWHLAVKGSPDRSQSASKAGMIVSLAAFLAWVVF